MIRTVGFAGIEELTSPEHPPSVTTAQNVQPTIATSLLTVMFLTKPWPPPTDRA